MSKKSKKQQKRQHRQRRRRRQNLIALFEELYPSAPTGMAERVVHFALTAPEVAEQDHRSSTAMLSLATRYFVRQHLTGYSNQVSQYMDSVLHSIATGREYDGKSPFAIEKEADTQAETIITVWQND